MQTFNNFSELLTANTISSSPADPCFETITNYFFQDIIRPFEGIEKVGVSIHSHELTHLDEPKNRNTWENLKHNPMRIGMFIDGYSNDDTKLATINATIDTQTGVLIADDKYMGKIKESPANLIISAIAQYNENPKAIDIPTIIERAIGEFIDSNIDKFNWRKL